MSKTATAPAIEISANCEVLLIVLELGERKWKIGFSSGFGKDVLERNIDSRDTAALMKEIERARRMLGLGEAARIVSCYEAGRDGFWLHRFLEHQGMENLIVDSASIETSRKSRRAKTDRLDLGSLMDLLARHLAGSRKPVWSVVNVPSIEDEDRRHLHRELKLAKQDRTRVSNRIKGLLANNGLTMDRRKNIPEQIRRRRLWDGSPIPKGLQARLERYTADYDYYTRRIAELEAQRRERIRDGEDGAAEKVRQLCLLRGVGSNTAWLYVMEFFGWRRFRNGKQVGSLAGLTPTPKDSGAREREQGIGKDGSRHIRGSAIEFAWGWLRFQPHSYLSQWYERRFGSGSKRLRKIGIVALARKLLVALWRYLETGVIPDGAELKTAARVR